MYSSSKLSYQLEWMNLCLKKWGENKWKTKFICWTRKLISCFLAEIIIFLSTNRLDKLSMSSTMESSSNTHFIHPLIHQAQDKQCHGTSMVTKPLRLKGLYQEYTSCQIRAQFNLLLKPLAKWRLLRAPFILKLVFKVMCWLLD